MIGLGERLIPRTSDRLVADFTTDERKAIYEYVVANTAKPEIGADIADINNMEQRNNGEKEMSLIELLVQERNLKRRRAKHKGIHTNKKSQIEILRELINQQMEVYADYMAAQNQKHTDDATEPSETEKFDERLHYSEEAYSRSSTSHSNSASKSRNGRHFYSTDDYCYERFVEEYEHKPKEHRKTHRTSQEYDRHSYESRNKSKKRKHSDRRSRSRSRSHSRDRKSHEKRHKHHSKESRHKTKKHKSSDRHSVKHSEHRRKEKERRRNDDL